MKTVTLLNEKGGVGKTTIATHIATGLALKGYQVVMIESDPQANATTALALAKSPEFHDLFVRNKTWKDALRMVHPDVFSPPQFQSKGRLYAVPDNIESKNVASTMTGRDVIRQRFLQLKSAIDYIVIDTSPTPSRLNEDILLASDYVVIPTDCEAFSALEGLPASIQHTKNANQALARIDINGSNFLASFLINFGHVLHCIKTFTLISSVNMASVFGSQLALPALWEKYRLLNNFCLR